MGTTRLEDDRERRRDRRGQASLIGLVLLLGIVAVGSLAIVVWGSAALDVQRTNAEVEHAEGALVQFSVATETAVSRNDTEGVAFGRFDQGTLEVREDAGAVTVTHVTDGEDVLYDEPLGSVVYAADGAEVAYQGGGVWRSDGEGSVPVSTPAVDYGGETVTLPLVHLEGDVSPHGDAAVGPTGSPVAIDPLEHENTVQKFEKGTIRIDLESDYCDGWERHLEREIPGTVAESCESGQSDRLVLEFDVPLRIGDIDSAIVAEVVDVHRNAPPIEGDVRAAEVDDDRVEGTVYGEGYVYPSVDDLIDAKLAECGGDFQRVTGEISDPEVYCTDELTGDLEVDTANGDVEVVVRESIGDPTYQGDLLVSGGNNLTVYADGDLEARGNARIGDDSDPSRTRLLFSSNATVSTANGSPELSALVYAPESTANFQGNPLVRGSIVAERVEVGNIEPGTIEYHDHIAEVAIVAGDDAPLVRYFHVTGHELTLEAGD